MNRTYAESELLPLSGIQHFYFCRRQWALIHVERQWQENVFTVEGKLLHERADDPFFEESRSGVIITRSMPVRSYQLGLTGVCDVVEFHPDEDGFSLRGRKGFFRAVPVEYKRGREKEDQRDEIQLCAQAMCLEDMLVTGIPFGYLYYGQTRRRQKVLFTLDLRETVARFAQEMHAYYARGYTPKVKPTRSCRSCSLRDLCLPELAGKVVQASYYIQKHLDEE